MDVSARASRDEVAVAKRKVTENALTKWQEKNPLRQWREQQPPEGWTRALLARQLDVSHTAVASWENGTRLPVVDAFAKIEKLTGIRTAEWMEWYNKKPEVK